MACPARTGVMRQLFDVFGEPLSLKYLKRLDDPCVQYPSPLLEQTAIGDFMCQGVPEGVVGRRKQTCFVEKFGGVPR